MLKNISCVLALSLVFSCLGCDFVHAKVNDKKKDRLSVKTVKRSENSIQTETKDNNIDESEKREKVNYSMFTSNVNKHGYKEEKKIKYKEIIGRGSGKTEEEAKEMAKRAIIKEINDFVRSKNETIIDAKLVSDTLIIVPPDRIRKDNVDTTNAYIKWVGRKDGNFEVWLALNSSDVVDNAKRRLFAASNTVNYLYCQARGAAAKYLVLRQMHKDILPQVREYIALIISFGEQKDFESIAKEIRFFDDSENRYYYAMCFTRVFLLSSNSDIERLISKNLAYHGFVNIVDRGEADVVIEIDAKRTMMESRGYVINVIKLVFRGFDIFNHKEIGRYSVTFESDVAKTNKEAYEESIMPQIKNYFAVRNVMDLILDDTFEDRPNDSFN